MPGVSRVGKGEAMTWFDPSDSVVLDAITGDVELWYRAQTERDIQGMHRITARIAQRRVDANQWIQDEDNSLIADDKLRPVEAALVVPEPTSVPAADGSRSAWRGG